MKKLLLGIAVLALATTVFAQPSTTGIAFAHPGIGLTTRGTRVLVHTWVAATTAGIYGYFFYAEDWDGGAFDPEVVVSLDRFLAFQCQGNTALFGGLGYVNGAPRGVLFMLQDNFWGPDFFAIATFHPISGALIYDRWGVLLGGRILVMCDGPNGPGGG